MRINPYILAFVLPMAGQMAVGANESIIDFAAKLESMPSFAAMVSYEILLPSATDPIIYNVSMESIAAEADTLSQCDYLINWSVDTPSGPSEGFSAYYDGNHFRFRDDRLQEYHAQWDMVPFAPGGDVERGVHRQVQFAELLPQYIGATLREMASDTNYVFQWRVTDSGATLRGVHRVSGYDCLEYDYAFDSSGRPLRIALENNPGMISEQTVMVRYRYDDGREAQPVTLERLIAMAPDAFGRFRQSNFSLETLPGRRMPEFTAPTITAERYTHHAGDSFGAATIIALVDADVASTPAVISDVREAVAMLPGQLDVIWAFVSNKADDIEPLLGEARVGEYALMGARALARDSGAATTPSLIICKADGTVSDVVVGYNNDMPSLVIQKAMIALQ